ncbi:unnamed protein product [marine sediment metagenome]|uniref:Uncharacterized protein n=1 Tax=marine sediment metagenome TaxID=412755 RepID=X1CD75_9ZZZZ
MGVWKRLEKRQIRKSNRFSKPTYLFNKRKITGILYFILEKFKTKNKTKITLLKNSAEKNSQKTFLGRG